MKTEKKINNNNFNNISMSQIYLKMLHNFHNQKKGKEPLKTNRIKSSSCNGYKNSYEMPYSIKPLLCSVPKDVNLQEIFVNMMNSSFKINGKKSIYLKMSQKELKLRKYILNCIKVYFNEYRFQKKLICSIIFLYDILTIRNIDKKLISTPEEIAIGATFLSLKFINGKKKSAFSIKNFSEIFSDDKIVEKDINEIEINCLKLMEYYLSYASPITFMEILFINGIIFSTDNIKKEDGGKIYEQVIEIIEKIMIISNEYIKYNPLCLCSCIVAFAREIYNLEKWPQILAQAFGVNFNSFEDIYTEFHDLIIPKYNIESPEEENVNYHKKGKTNINREEFEEINDNKNEMKLHTSSSVIENKPNTYRLKKQVKFENEKQPKNCNNLYSNPNYLLNKQLYSNEKTERNNPTSIYSKYIKNKIKKNNFSNIYDKDKEKGVEILQISSKKIEEIDVNNLTDKKNSSVKFLYDNKLNSNYNNKINRKIYIKNKEEDYSNVATSENSSNYRNNFKKNYNNKNRSSNNKYSLQYIENKDYNESNNLYQSAIIPPSQKHIQKNCERWESTKKYNRMRNENITKDSFFPVSETKSIYVNKIYK